VSKSFTCHYGVRFHFKKNSTQLIGSHNWNTLMLCMFMQLTEQDCSQQPALMYTYSVHWKAKWVHCKSFKLFFTSVQYVLHCSWCLLYNSYFYSSCATILTWQREVFKISVILRTDQPTTDLCSWKSLPGRTSNGHISITVLDRCMVTMDHP